MKTAILKFWTQLLLVILFQAASLSLQGQACTPDSSYTRAGVYNDSLPATCIGLYFEARTTVVVPVDTLVNSPFGPVRLPIDSLELLRVNNIPAGLNYACYPSTCSFPGGSYGCSIVSGIPTVAGVYHLQAVYRFNYTIAGTPQSLLDSMAVGTLVVEVPPVATIVQTQLISCYGLKDGGLAASATGSARPFTYSWNNGSTDSMLTSLESMIYELVLTDTLGCTDSVSINLTQPAQTIFTTDIQHPTCAGDSGSIRLIHNSGGNQPFVYTWQTTPPVSGDSLMALSGQYMVAIRDQDNCMDTLGHYVLIDPPVMSLAMNTVAGKAWVMTSGGQPPYTYSWSNGGTSDTISNLPGGMYVVTVTDTGGCSMVDSINVSPATAIEGELLAGILGIQVFPNPVQNKLNVNLKLDHAAIVELSLLDATGRLLDTRNWQSIAQLKTQIDMSNIPSGIYFIQIKTEKGLISRKVIR